MDYQQEKPEYKPEFDSVDEIELQIMEQYGDQINQLKVEPESYNQIDSQITKMMQIEQVVEEEQVKVIHEENLQSLPQFEEIIPDPTYQANTIELPDPETAPRVHVKRRGLFSACCAAPMPDNVQEDQSNKTNKK